MNYRTLIIDDEPMARRRLRRLLSAAADLEIVGEIGDGRSAVGAIRELRPDLIFLDVQMPECDGFQVLRETQIHPPPVVVFVTAFDEFALQAFEAQALDYVLKPFGAERIHRALDRARVQLQRLETTDVQNRLTRLLAKLETGPAEVDRLMIKTNGRIVFLKAGDIAWMQAVGDYVKVHAGGEAHLIRGTMQAMEKRFARHGFVRIHRSRMVNLDHVKEVRPLFDGEATVFMRSGEHLAASRACVRALTTQLQAPGRTKPA